MQVESWKNNFCHRICSFQMTNQARRVSPSTHSLIQSTMQVLLSPIKAPRNHKPDSQAKHRLFLETLLHFESQLKQMLKYSLKCGSLIVKEEMKELQNEGSQLTLDLSCVNGCNSRWQSQPTPKEQVTFFCQSSSVGSILQNLNGSVVTWTSKQLVKILTLNWGRGLCFLWFKRHGSRNRVH